MPKQKLSGYLKKILETPYLDKLGNRFMRNRNIFTIHYFPEYPNVRNLASFPIRVAYNNFYRIKKYQHCNRNVFLILEMELAKFYVILFLSSDYLKYFSFEVLESTASHHRQ
ncbi:unnamed protein product [Meganyctiphanes norvegica]|uniref:Uncharacterized protein n=1 Tax=Meganyctiphanes norvegica TaxID=48144 RepID=A0AAV2S802_MEGNR